MATRRITQDDFNTCFYNNKKSVLKATFQGIGVMAHVACSRLSVVGDERKRAGKKRGRTKARSDGRACKTFFNDPLLV